MSGDEVFVLFFSLFLAMLGLGANWLGRLHPLYFRGNAAPGVVRLGVLLSMAWIGFVLAFFADPSVTSVYVVFYLVMGYAVVKLFGQTVVAAFGGRTRVDAGERRNLGAGIVIGAFTLATGLIFGGSLWGEADPVGEGEGGWWIPAAFFLMGWLVLVGAFMLFLQREKGSFARRIRSERGLADARAAATFLLGSGVTLTDAVSGDFWGWRHGILTFGLIASMLLVHEFFAAWTGRDEIVSRTSRKPAATDPRRMMESAAYLLLAALVWFLNRLINTLWGPG
jgi:hypothetical protein